VGAQEFGRDIEWTDWADKTYSLRSEWSYVNGPAIRRTGCTPGVRDDLNEGMLPGLIQCMQHSLCIRYSLLADGACTVCDTGMLPSDFVRVANEAIIAGRAAGRGVTVLEDEDEERRALLTLDEVLALRLYSGPAFQPINEFLRIATGPRTLTIPVRC
jgi:hypothetical protein